MRTRSDGEPPPGGTACPAAAEHGAVPAARTAAPAVPAAPADLGTQAEPDAGRAVAALYEMHYRQLVRLAALLVSDLATAEDIVQESFAAVHGMWHALPDAGAALCYLRRSVVHRARTAAHPQAAARPRIAARPGPTGAADAADHPEADPLPQDSAVVTALRTLPVRQREVLVLQYFADLPEAEIASATGLSTSAVRNHAARGMSSLHAALYWAGE